MTKHLDSSRAVGLLIGFTALAVYLYGADRGLEYDGSVTVGNFVAVEGLLTPLRRQIVFNNHPVFSMIEHLVYSAGGDTERWLVLFPAACGAATVGLVTAALAAERGIGAGVAAGLLIAANPWFAELSRQVRGYSLMCLLAIATTHAISRKGQDFRPSVVWSLAYIVAVAAAVGTHLYAGLALVAHVSIVVVRRQLSIAWIARWCAALALGIGAYAWILPAMLEELANRPGTFRPRFPLETVRFVLGEQPVAMVILVALVACSIPLWMRSWAVWLAAAGIAIVVGYVWLVRQPFDLYPRFLLPLVVAAGVAAALGGSRLPAWLFAPATGVAVAAMAVFSLPTWTADATPFKAAAGIAQAAIAEGAIPCVGYYYTEALNGYGLFLRSASEPSHLEGCDVLLIVEGGPAGLTPEARARYPHFRRIHGRGAAISIYARGLESRLYAPPATIPPHRSSASGS